jgi:mannose-6-phosphate isomerase-like protein (cupin superfamily)
MQRVALEVMTKRRDLWKAAAMLAPMSALGASLPNVTMDPKQARLQREPFGDLRFYFEGPTDQLKSMTAGSLLLKPGMTPHPPHQHPEEEFMVITEGTGEISMEGKIARCGPGSMMYSAANKLHGIVNTGKTPLLFYFYKWQK